MDFNNLLQNFYPRFKELRLNDARTIPLPRGGVRVGGMGSGVAAEIGMARQGRKVSGGWGTNDLPAGISAEEAAGLPEQGYILKWDAEPLVWGRDYAGFYYGCVTLATLMNMARENGVRETPEFFIRDYPRTKRRGVMVDYGRGLSFNLEWAKRFILRLASFKINEFHFYFENRLEMQSIPFFSPDHSATQEDIRELIHWAAGHAVTIVPQANMLAHNEEILRIERYAHLREDRDIEEAYMMCPSSPETLEILSRQIEEMAALFDSPFIHVGCDEPAGLGSCPACSERASRIGGEGIYLEHLAFLRREIEKRGKRMAFWGDVLFHDYEKNVKEGKAGKSDLARAYAGTVPFDWSYGGHRPDSLRFFREAGFETYATTTTTGWCHLFTDYSNGMEKAAAFLEDAQETNALGSIICIWEVHLGMRADHQLPEVCHYGALMWDERPVGDREFLDFFGRSILGMQNDRFASFVLDTSRLLIEELQKVIPVEKRQGGYTREWRYEVYSGSDPLYAWKNLRDLNDEAIAYFEAAASSLSRSLEDMRIDATRNRDILKAWDTPLLCLETAALRLKAGDRLRQAYRLMDSQAPEGRETALREAISALDMIGTDLRRHQISEKEFIRTCGGDYHSLNCMRDVQERLNVWKRDIRRAARQRRMPALDLLLSLRNYRDPYPTTLRRFDTNKTLIRK